MGAGRELLGLPISGSGRASSIVLLRPEIMRSSTSVSQVEGPPKRAGAPSGINNVSILPDISAHPWVPITCSGPVHDLSQSEVPNYSHYRDFFNAPVHGTDLRLTSGSAEHQTRRGAPIVLGEVEVDSPLDVLITDEQPV